MTSKRTFLPSLLPSLACAATRLVLAGVAGFLILGAPARAADAPTPAPAAPETAAPAPSEALSAPAPAIPAAPADSASAEPAGAAAKPKKARPASAARVAKAGKGPGAVVITVGSNKITRNQIDLLVEQMSHANPNPRVLDDREKTAMAAMIATNLIGQELLDLEGRRLAIVAPETEVDSMYKLMRANFPDEATWKKVLKEGGNTEKSFREKLARQIKADKILNKQIPQAERPTNKEIIDHFAAHKAKYPVNDTLRAAQILLMTPKEMKAPDMAMRKADLEKIRAELSRDSADPDRLLARFMMAARQVSDGPEKKDGGDLQSFHPGDFAPEFKKQALALKVGQMSPVFKTPLGWHLVLLTGKHDGKPDGYRYFIARAIAAEKAAVAGRSLRKYLQGLAEKYKVNYLESAYRDTSPTGVYNL